MSERENNLLFLKEVYNTLLNANIETVVFGGWAEELQKVIPPRKHKDIDLLYIAEQFDALDAFIKENSFEIIKSFSHKRAFLYKGIMIEVFLVTQSGSNYTTNFFEEYVHVWPFSLSQTQATGIKVASIETLREYREKHTLVEKALLKYNESVLTQKR